MPRLISLAFVITAVACAGVVPPDGTAVWGEVQLVPHADLRSSKSTANAYGDRRLRSADLVDYSRPGFSVVYLDAPANVSSVPGDENEVALAVRGGQIRARFEPSRLAMQIGSVIRLRNLDHEPHVVSCPEAAVLQRVGPGEEVRLQFSKPGDYGLYLADVPGADGIIFVAPGPFAVTSDTGRFAISDLPAGTWTLHAWHPRFPPASRSVVLAEGHALEVDIQIGVGQRQETSP